VAGVVIDFPQLSEWCGYKRRADVAKWLRKNGIHFWLDIDGGPVTTQNALDRALVDVSSGGQFRLPHETTPESPRKGR